MPCRRNIDEMEVVGSALANFKRLIRSDVIFEVQRIKHSDLDVQLVAENVAM